MQHSKLKETLDILRDNEMMDMSWLDSRTIILAPVGSYAHGTNIETSDNDYKGICTPPIEYYLGLKSFNEYNSAGGKDFKNSKDDIDISIIHISKFVKQAMQGSPPNIEILFTRQEDFIKVTEPGQILINNRHLFLSKFLKTKFIGFSKARIKEMESNNANGTGRVELIQIYGYDVKAFAHAVRILTSAIEILKTGDFTTYRPNRKFLIECKLGKYTIKQAYKLLGELENELKDTIENSKLPEIVDYNRINQMLIEINKKALDLSYGIRGIA